MIAQLVAAAVGMWLMAAPAVLGYGGTGADDAHRILGPIAATVGLVAVFQATRGARRANYVVGALLVVLALFLGGPVPAIVNGIVTGAALLILAAIEGRRSKRIGGGWRALVDDDLL